MQSDAKGLSVPEEAGILCYEELPACYFHAETKAEIGVWVCVCTLCLFFFLLMLIYCFI